MHCDATIGLPKCILQGMKQTKGWQKEMSQKWWYCVKGFSDSLGTYVNKKPTEEETAELEVILCKRSRKRNPFKRTLHYILLSYDNF